MAAQHGGTVPKLRIDEILPYIDEFGKFQIVFNAILCLLKIPTGNALMMPYFTHKNPPWRCITGSNSNCNLNGTFSPSSKDYLYRCRIPRSDWEYTQAKDYSVVTQYDLSCGREPYNYLATSVVFLGWAIGAWVLGWMTDRFGRRMVMLVSTVAVMTFNIIGAFSPSLWMYATFRFLTGFFIPGNLLNSYVIITEYVGPKLRPLFGRSQWITACLGIIIMGVTAIYVKSWKILTVTAMAPYFIVVLLFRYIPESVRWLQLQGRTDEVKEILESIAKVNKKQLPEFELAELKQEKSIGLKHFFEIFRPRKIAIRSLIQGYMWFTTGLVYFGVSFSTDDLGGDMYRDFILSVVVDILGNMTAIYLSNKIGRRKTTISSMLVAGSSCIVVALIPQASGATGRKTVWTVLRIFNGLLGKFCISMSFASIYVWSAELYPTITRGAGMGYLQVAARIGAALAPWVAKWLKVVHIILPYALMGGSAFLCGVLMLWLPETADKSTIETLDDQFFYENPHTCEMKEINGNVEVKKFDADIEEKV